MEEIKKSQTTQAITQPVKREKDTEPRWYVLHTFSGYENVAKTNLEVVIKKYNLEERIFDIIIPMEETIEERNGKRKLVQRKVMPCYLIVKMIYGDDIWHDITRTRGITGFVGPKGRPLALTEDEIRKLRLEISTVKVDVKPNDRIEIVSGGFNGVIGTVVSVDTANRRCKALLDMGTMGEVSAEVELSQIRRI
jgi:transcriptional antiterminator NusG